MLSDKCQKFFIELYVNFTVRKMNLIRCKSRIACSIELFVLDFPFLVKDLVHEDYVALFSQFPFNGGGAGKVTCGETEVYYDSRHKIKKSWTDITDIIR